MIRAGSAPTDLDRYGEEIVPFLFERLLAWSQHDPRDPAYTHHKREFETECERVIDAVLDVEPYRAHNHPYLEYALHMRYLVDAAGDSPARVAGVMLFMNLITFEQAFRIEAGVKAINPDAGVLTNG